MISFNRTSLAIGLGLTAFLAACGTPDGEFPSLARRAYEIDGPNKATETTEPAAPVSLPPDLAASVDALVKRHNAADASFQKGLPAMRNLAANAAGAPPGTESWVNAHMLLSRLDSERADSVAVLGEMDKLIAGQIEADSAYVELLVNAQQRIATQVAAQRTEIEEMSTLIGE